MLGGTYTGRKSSHLRSKVALYCFHCTTDPLLNSHTQLGIMAVSGQEEHNTTFAHLDTIVQDFLPAEQSQQEREADIGFERIAILQTKIDYLKERIESGRLKNAKYPTQESPSWLSANTTKENES